MHLDFARFLISNASSYQFPMRVLVEYVVCVVLEIHSFWLIACSEKRSLFVRNTFSLEALDSAKS